jgi:hypothetical protein
MAARRVRGRHRIPVIQAQGVRLSHKRRAILIKGAARSEALATADRTAGVDIQRLCAITRGAA